MTIKTDKLCFPVFVLCVVFALVACGDSPYFRAYTDFEDGRWHSDSTVQFSFYINEPSIPHNVSLLVRNSLSYPFYNLYVKYELADAEGQTLENNVNEIQLMHEKTGEPFGEIKKPSGRSAAYYFDHSFKLLDGYVFPKPGTYQITIKHYMRSEVLQEIMAVGVETTPSN